MIRLTRRAMLAATLFAAGAAFAFPSSADDHANTTIKIDQAFTRAMPPNARTGGGFLRITNIGAADDRLVSASSPESQLVQIHEMRMEDDVMVMRELIDGIAIPAGAEVRLQPGGLHLMFIDALTPFAEGETVSVTLSFEQAGEITLELPVAALGATEMPMAHE